MPRLTNSRSDLRPWVSACLLTLFPLLLWAQAPGDPRQPANQFPAAKRTGPESEEQKISPEEAEQLFHSVDEILHFDSKETGLPIRQTVKRRLTSRDEVVAYLQKNMSKDKDAQRLRRSELVLKKFGLLPRDFDLQTFLLSLLREQVAGYYDPKTQTVNLLDWLGPEQQRPVLAHELTHALQDQSFALDKWMKSDSADPDSGKQPTVADIEEDEVSEARQAVVEGQAMVTLIDYMLAPAGQSLLASPQVATALKQGMLVGTSDSPQFQNAPLFLREALTFPYRYGLDFIAELLRAGGKEKAFAGLFTNPPLNTRQIMEPRTYISAEQLQPLPLPDFQQDFGNYERFDVGSMGELDTATLIEQYAGAEASRELYPYWRGGYYYAARPKGEPTAPLALLYLSRWAGPEQAASFAAIYARAINQRYGQVHESVSGAAKPFGDLSHLVTLTGVHTWLTEAGPVVIAVKNDMVLITESLDQPTTGKLQHELLPGPAAAK